MNGFALEMNRDHSVVFEIASKYCISDSFVDHDGYSISSKGFLPTAVAGSSCDGPCRNMAERSYHMPKVRGGRQEELPHVQGGAAAWAQEDG